MVLKEDLLKALQAIPTATGTEGPRIHATVQLLFHKGPYCIKAISASSS